MAVLGDGLDETAGTKRLALERGAAFVDVPAEVQLPLPGPRDVIDLFDRALADVADPEIAVRAVERKTPRVADSEGDDHGLRGGAGRIEPEHLAEKRGGVLGTVLGISARAPVAHADVDEAVSSVCHHATVVVGIRLLDEEQLLRARPEGLRAVGAVAHDTRVAVPIRVVDDELPALRVVGSEREPQQALLAARAHFRAHVKERLRPDRAPLDDADKPSLLHHVQQAGSSGSPGDVNRRLEAVDDPDEPESSFSLSHCSGARGRNQHDDKGGYDGGSTAHVPRRYPTRSPSHQASDRCTLRRP